jgi:hypothetical protein
MQKAERVNRIKNSLHSEDELVRRLPEIDAIYDDEIRACVVRTFLNGCPDYFWEKPTSSTGKYHSPDERGKHGNWIHTKRVFATYVNMSESYLETGRLTEKQRESGKAAALLHDMMKYGWPSDGNEHTVNNHDVIAANVARHIGDCSNEIYLLIHGHMGPWAEGMTPENERQWLFHLADKSASGIDEDDLAVYYPAQELLDEWPEIQQIEHEDGEAV